VGTATGLPLQIGLAYPTSTGEQFKGIIDDISIWNVARTQAQIQTDMNSTLAGTETNLVGLFNFNQGIGGGDNTGLITAIDGTVNNNHATLNNFALTGPTSNWVGRNAALPVTWMSFTATRKKSSIELDWSTASENSSDYFEVERSSDSRNFTTIGKITAAGTSYEQSKYSFEDNQPLTSNSYYRLKQVDKDGKSKYSTILIVKGQEEKLTIALSPQPMHERMNVSITGSTVKGNFILYNLSGSQLKSYPVNATNGNTSIQVDRNNLTSGIYFYKLISDNGALITSGKIIID
jgi:hypothetical protein